MFGNTLGWIMSGAIAALVALLIVFGGRPPSISPPTGQFTKIRDSSALSIEPRSLGVKPGNKDCDAGDLYRRVIDDYKANRFQYKRRFEEAKDPVGNLEKDPPPSIGWVVEAADCYRAKLFSRNPREVVNYENSLDSIEALHAVGNYVGRLAAVQIKDKKFDLAEPYLRGEFVLGLHLYEERLRWLEYTVGTELMNEAVNGMIMIAKAKHDDARADELARFLNTMDSYQKRARPLWQAISGVGADGQPLPNAGDIFDFARNEKTDPMWRTEAILKLGRMRYMGNVEVGDQRGANRVTAHLAEKKSELPPGVAAAAEAAHNLTVENFRKFGGGS